MRTPFLRGKKVVLGAIADGDVPTIAGWINDPEIYVNLLITKPNREQDSRTRLEAFCTAADTQMFAICLHDGKLIGVMGLHEIDWVHRNATSGAFIGSAEHRGQGYGLDAKMLVCYHAFCTLNLHKLYTHAYEFNAVSLRYNAKCGYREEGRRREHYFRAGRYWDVVETGLLRPEWLPLWEAYRAGDASIRVPEPKLA
ncbi:MAG: GNAT family N-acetyltransferase [bacterium]|nr:GNAT family N-acetyltransferase [bacterium]